ncbi:MAG: PASTA domain-containing protein [Prevotella sp.]|nr:PASTA domain-containing protein [Prevotella sp.]
MLIVAVLLLVGVKLALDIYTHHGESLTVPSVKHKKVKDAHRILDDMGLVVIVGDTGYVKSLPPDVVLEQSVAPGETVKSGRIIYLTVNALTTPTITLPDIIDNSSLREAMAKLSAMGFKLAMPEFIPGERDWVYGVTVRGRNVVTGDKISIEDSVVIQVGNGLRDITDSINYIDPIYPEIDEEEELDEFELGIPKKEEETTTKTVES